MVIIKNIEDCKLEKSVVALGKFDGVHLGHQAIVQELKRDLAPDVQVVIITFSVAPEAVLSRCQLKYLVTNAEKKQYFEKLGVNYLIDVQLDEAFLNMEALEFTEQYLVKNLGVQKVACGNNFCFGKGRKGDADFLAAIGRQYNFEVSVVEPVMNQNKEQISSTRIRSVLADGRVDFAGEMMGHPYEISGTVIRGRQLGRQLQFPTINVLPPRDKILPANGVYATKCVIGQNVYDSITNVGVRPTVTDDTQAVIETNIFDYSGDLYDSEVRIVFCQQVRKEKKFKSVEDLQKQIKKDVEFVKSVDNFLTYDIM